MDFIAKEISDYAENHTKPESKLLEELNRDTWANVLMPRMLSGHIQGKILASFSHMMRPERILEIGTYTGYSALCMAEGLTENGKLISIDLNEELEEMVRKYIDRSEFSSKIDFRVGNAIEIIPILNETFDLVFIDADKENYVNYFHMILPKVRKGGFIIADNVLWSGKVLDENIRQKDLETRSLHEFNELVQSSPDVENVLFPVRDGLMVMRKL